MNAGSALLTGAAGGLGRALAAGLLESGFSLVVSGRSGSALSELVAELRGRWPDRDITQETCDLGNDDEAGAMMARLAAGGRSPAVLINNAAVQGPIGRFASVGWAAFTATIAVDLLAPIRLTQLALPAMLERGWGRIINISGGGATGPRPDFSAYAVAKTGLVRFTETLAHELRGSGVTVNAVAPGPMNTRMLDEVLQAGPERAALEYSAAVARARDGGVAPEQAARLVVWLASPASARVTGRLLSAVWDPWERLHDHQDVLEESDIYTLRRIVPKDRGQDWGDTP